MTTLTAYLLMMIILLPTVTQAISGTTFVNPLYGTNDPSVVKGPDGNYYQVQSNDLGDGSGRSVIIVYKSTGLTERGNPRVVWTSPGGTAWNGYEAWALEIQYINGKWYIYYAATYGPNGSDNAGHRLGVLEADTADPQSTYTDRGKVIPTNYDDHWQLDGAVLQKNDGSLYFVWSGWPGSVDGEQRLYIASMSDPKSVNSARVELSSATLNWEKIGMPIQEGPEFLKNGSKTFIIYSTSGSWTAEYSYGMLTNTDGNYLNPGSWAKSGNPVFSKNVGGGVYGPGHGSFVKSKDGTEDWMIYHSSMDSGGSWNRVANIKKFTWNADGSPNFGVPPAWGSSTAIPSGEPANTAGGSFFDTFNTNSDNWVEIGAADSADWDVTGYWTTIRRDSYWNNYIIDGSGDQRHGDKAYIRGYDWSNFTLDTDICLQNSPDGNFAGGVFFRARNVGSGIDRFDGYAATLDAVNGIVSLGYSSNNVWTTLVDYRTTVSRDIWHHMKIVANGNNVKVYYNNMTVPVIDYNDTRYTTGVIGARTVDSRMVFDNFTVTAQ